MYSTNYEKSNININIKLIFINKHFCTGEYAVRILSKNDDIPKSPYMVPVTDKGAVTSKPSEAPAAKGVPVVDASKVG